MIAALRFQIPDQSLGDLEAGIEAFNPSSFPF
jgi:hypothetical protein